MDKTKPENKVFFGTRENAVHIQINTAIITYCLVSIFQNEHKIIQVLGISLLDKTSVNQLFKYCNCNNVNEINCNQLKIKLF